MPIESPKHHSLVAAAAASVACLALVSGCGSSAKSTGAAGSAGSAGSASRPAAGGSPTSAAAAGGGSGSVSTSCPTPAVVSASLKYTFPAPKQSGNAGSVLCSYSDAAGDNLVVIFAPLPGGTAAALKVAMDAQAQAQKVAADPVPGLGEAAYLFTMDDASTNPDNVNTTNLAVLVGGQDVDITATAPPAEVEALARSIIGG